MALTDAQIKDLAKKILAADGPGAEVPIPANNDTPLETAMKAVVATNADFAAYGLCIIDFTKDLQKPKVWMQNVDKAWRLGSTSKVAVLLAAAQLREDVRQVMGKNIISKPDEFDALFQDKRLWGPSKIKRTDDIATTPPRISTLFDFSKSPIDFAGPNINSPDATAINTKLTSKGGLKNATIPEFAFSELLWMMAAQSDDLAADCCISEIGVPYIKAVLRKYGLFKEEEKKGMRFLLSEGFTGKFNGAASGIAVNKGTQHYRSWGGFEEDHEVKDKLSSVGFRSHQSGSPTAMTAYMIALMGDHFANGTVACDLIRNNMSNGKPPTLGSFLANGTKIDAHGTGSPAVNGGGSEGINDIATFNRQHDKIGILTSGDGELKPDGSTGGFLITEFVFLDTKETSGAPRPMQYAIVSLGMQTGAFIHMGQPIHQALLKLNHP